MHIFTYICRGVGLVLSCVVWFWLCVCVCDLFLFLHIYAPPSFLYHRSAPKSGYQHSTRTQRLKNEANTFSAQVEDHPHCIQKIDTTYMANHPLCVTDDL